MSTADTAVAHETVHGIEHMDGIDSLKGLLPAGAASRGVHFTLS